MQTLAQLESGALKGITKLTLSEGLSLFPEAIFDLADSLEVLDLSGNQLSSLPDNLADLTQLKILFCSNNLFTSVPTCLAACPKLEMIGFRNNQITNLPENALPLQTRWLILTDNALTTLPDSFGQLSQLRKCALAGNQLASLPASMKGCQRLELLRISANRLTALPDELLTLPKLTWLAFSGNDFCQSKDCADANEQPEKVHLDDLEMHEPLGEGASGLIYRAKWAKEYAELQRSEGHSLPKNIAVKIFKGAVTSDGYPKDELAIGQQIGHHINLVEMLAEVSDCQVNHSSQSSEMVADTEVHGMVMSLIPKKFFNLGNPPSLQTCTRDTFSDDSSLPATGILEVLIQTANAMAHLHSHHVSHGDLYAHNILINKKHSVLLGDFGAASNFGVLPEAQQALVKTLEVRAFANLIEDLLTIVKVSPMGTYLQEILVEFVDYCRTEAGLSFAEVAQELINLREL